LSRERTLNCQGETGLKISTKNVYLFRSRVGVDKWVRSGKSDRKAWTGGENKFEGV